MTDEREPVALMKALRSLTAGQPPPPHGRYAAIRRRVTLRRRWQAGSGAVALVAAAAVGAAAPGWLASVVPSTPSTRSVPSWALPWPDHSNGSVPPGVADGVVLAWRHLMSPAGPPISPPSRVVWYLRRLLNGEVAVVFEAKAKGRAWLVAGMALRSAVMQGQPAWLHGKNPWALTSVPAPARSQASRMMIGLYALVPGPARAGNFPRNAIVVLSAPDVRSLRWTARTPAGQKSGSIHVDHGLALAVPGALRSRVSVRALVTGQGNILAHPVFLGIPGSPASQIPHLALPAPLSLPNSFLPAWGATDQGPTRNVTPATALRPEIIGRCDGPGPVRIRHSPGAAPGQLWGTIPCDGRQHELQRRSGWAKPGVIIIAAGQLTTYQLAYGYPR